jgi:hypothetical protein
VLVPLSPPERALLVVGMTTERGEYHEDTVLVEASTKFYVWLKYLVLLPLLLLVSPLFFMKPQQTF